jgi:CDP-diglyceride synthetase
MPSSILISTAVASFLGIILNSVVLYLVFSHRTRIYHLLFSTILLICAIWDCGIFLSVVRNNHPQEIEVYGNIVTLPCILLPALIFHFTESYLGLSHTRSVWFMWVICAVSLVLMASGMLWPIKGVYRYPWGSIFRVDAPPIAVLFPLLSIPLTAAVSCFLLYRASQANLGNLASRHCLYILVGFSAIGLAMLKVFVIYGINIPLFLPLGMILNDIFAAVIGLAIVKQKLFDITIIVKKGALFSVVAAILLFVFSFSEHALTTYLGNMIGKRTQIPHIISIAIAIGVLLPIYRNLERRLDSYFEKRSIEF